MKRSRTPRAATAPTNIVRLPAGDPVFFRKNDIGIGTTLVYYGRHDPGCRWRVERIVEYSMVKGQWRGKAVPHPETLMAEVWLVRETQADKQPVAGGYMQLNFQYLSYSAIWRVEQ